MCKDGRQKGKKKVTWCILNQAQTNNHTRRYSLDTLHKEYITQKTCTYSNYNQWITSLFHFVHYSANQSTAQQPNFVLVYINKITKMTFDEWQQQQNVGKDIFL